MGGSPPDAILGDMAPEQVSGDATAGFYRSSDHRADDRDRESGLDVDRHVEVYSWGGLTSQSKVRVLWLALVWLASKSWRYEAVRPPYQVAAKRKEKARMVTAAALPADLADGEFWDGESSVRLITWVHVAVVTGFLAIALGVTTQALTGSPHVVGLKWIAIGLGAVTVTLGAGYLGLDALGTPAMDTAAVAGGSPADLSAPAGKRRGLVVYMLLPGAVALIAACVFAWVQPGAPAPRTAGLPGMASVIGWTALAIAVVAAIALISMLLGLPGGRGTLTGGPWITLMLAFGLLNTLMLGAELWVAHLVGPVTSNAADALSRPQGKIYLSYVITSGTPLLVWAAVRAHTGTGPGSLRSLRPGT